MPSTRIDVFEAARGGCLGDLKSEYARLKHRGETLPVWVCFILAEHGHKEVLEWAHKRGCVLDTWACAHAAFGSPLKVLNWLHRRQCPMDEETCAWAAKGGHHEVLRWARLNGAPWDNWTCANAAEGGHFVVLRWAKEHGCPFDAVGDRQNTRNWRVCAWAAKGGQLGILKWLREEEPPAPWSGEESTSVMLWASWNGHLELLKWAHKNGCPCGHELGLEITRQALEHSLLDGMALRVSQIQAHCFTEAGDCFTEAGDCCPYIAQYTRLTLFGNHVSLRLAPRERLPVAGHTRRGTRRRRRERERDEAAGEWRAVVLGSSTGLSRAMKRQRGILKAIYSDTKLSCLVPLLVRVP